MVNFFSSLFKKKSTSVVGIDIGASAIKIVQLKRKGGKAILETYGALALGPYANIEVGRATNLPVDKVINALIDILRESKTTTKSSAVSIPFSSSLMTIIEMPSVSEKQLETMVPIEARKYIPVPIAEVSLDWSVIPKDQTKDEPEMQEDTRSGPNLSKKIQKSDILLVAIHNDTLREYQEIVEKVGLESSFFEIEIFSTIRSVLDQNIQPVLILDMGAASTKIYIVERGIVKNSHTINRGSQDITTTISASLSIPIERAEIMKRTIGWSKDPANKELADMISLNLDFVFSEAKHVLLNYQAKHKKSIEKVVLVGGGSAMKGFVELAAKSLETPVILGDPFSKVEAPAFLTDVLRRNGPEFAVALGIALRKLQESE